MPTFAAVRVELNSQDLLAKPPLPEKKKEKTRSNLHNSSSSSNNNNSSINSKLVSFRQSFPSPNLYKTPQSAPIPHVPSGDNFSPYVINHKRRELRRPQKSDPQKLCDASRIGEKDGVPDSSGANCRNPEGSSGSANHRDPENHRSSGGTKDVGENGGSRDGAEIRASMDSYCKESDRSASGNSESFDGLGLGFQFDDLDVKVMDEDTVGPVSPCDDLVSSISRINTVGRSGSNEADDVVCFKFPVEDNLQFSPGDTDCTPRTNRSEFFDADDDLSAEDTTLQSVDKPSVSRLQTEIDSLKEKFAMETEKRVKLERSLFSWQKWWEETSTRMSDNGLSLPPFETLVSGGDKAVVSDFVDEVFGRLTVSRAVADAIGRVSVRAEMTEQMDKLISIKDFEIARLRDKIQYHELINREMSQRNQEAIELGRRRKQEQQRRQKWIWRSVAVTVVIGAASLACKYAPWPQIPDWSSLLGRNSDSNAQMDVVELN